MLRPRILVAEDDALVAADLRETLEELGYDVAAMVTSGDDAPAAARNAGAQLALLDIRMPGADDGIEAGRRIREGLGIPVVYLSAYADDPTLERARATSPMAYLVKPYEPRALRTAIEVALERHRVEAQLAESRERWRSTLTSIGEAVIAVDGAGRVTFMNPTARALTGVGTTDVEGRDAAEIVRFQDESTGAELPDPLRRAMEAGATVELLDGAVLVRPGGDAVPVAGRASPKLSAGADPTGAVLVFRDVRRARRSRKALERLALEDSLTGLPNRRLFRDRLEHALERARRDGIRVAVVFMDVDRFKVVNDTLGHAAGDHVLALVARRIRNCFRERDTVARLGGDEFGVLLEEIGGRGSVEDALGRLLASFSVPFEFRGVPMKLGISIGVALAGDDGSTADELLRFSDLAMYEAKCEGGGRFHFHDVRRDRSRRRWLDRENELRRALDREEFSLRYEPLVELASRRVVGAQVRVRWDHPKRGTLPPTEFMPVAEESGLILPLGRWVVTRACEHLREWRRLFVDPSSFTLGFDVSRRQLEDDALVEALDGILRQEGAEPGCLRARVAESTIVRYSERVAALKELGLGVAVEGFGTGSTAFTRLKALPVDALEIHSSFVRGLGEKGEEADEVIARTIIELGKGLGLSVVAHGVETAAQRKSLLGHGCALAQGALFHPPLPAAGFGVLLERSRQEGLRGRRGRP